MLTRALRHPIRATLWALVIALATVIGLLLLARTAAVDRIFDHFSPTWIVLVVLAELASVGAYALAYQRVVRRVASQRLSARVSVQMVLTGFGSFAFFGGFALDRRMLRHAGARPRGAQRSVVGLGVIELITLSTAAWVASLVLLFTHSTCPTGMLWPWIIGVPLVTSVVIGISHIGRRRGDRATAAERLASTMEEMLFGLMREPLAYLGIALYFAADITALDAALKAFGVAIDPGRLVVAYASGFLLTRRTLPLAGAGLVEALLTVSIWWVAAPFVPALAAVIAFRILNLGGIGALALIARRRLIRAYGLESRLALEARLRVRRPIRLPRLRPAHPALAVAEGPDQTVLARPGRGPAEVGDAGALAPIEPGLAERRVNTRR